MTKAVRTIVVLAVVGGVLLVSIAWLILLFDLDIGFGVNGNAGSRGVRRASEANTVQNSDLNQPAAEPLTIIIDGGTPASSIVGPKTTKNNSQ